MKFIEGKAVSGLDGRQNPALLAVCEECDCQTFNVFCVLIKGRAHQHLACTSCGQAYCDGTCDLRPEGSAGK